MQTGTDVRPFVRQGCPQPLLWSLWHPCLGCRAVLGRKPQPSTGPAAPGRHHAPQGQTRSSCPRRRDLRAPDPPRAPLPRLAPHKGPLSRGALGLRFLKSSKRKKKKSKRAAETASGQGRRGRAKAAAAARAVLSSKTQGQGSVGGSRKNHKNLVEEMFLLSLLSLFVVVVFFFCKRGTPGTEAGGSPGRRDLSPAAAKGRSEGPRVSLPPRQAGSRGPPGASFSLPRAVPTEAAAPPGKWREPPGLRGHLFPRLRVRPKAFPPRIVPRGSAPLPLRDGGCPKSASSPRGAPAFPSENMGSPGPRVLPSSRGVGPATALLFSEPEGSLPRAAAASPPEAVFPGLGSRSCRTPRRLAGDPTRESGSQGWNSGPWRPKDICQEKYSSSGSRCLKGYGAGLSFSRSDFENSSPGSSRKAWSLESPRLAPISAERGVRGEDSCAARPSPLGPPDWPLPWAQGSPRPPAGDLRLPAPRGPAKAEGVAEPRLRTPGWGVRDRPRRSPGPPPKIPRGQEGAGTAQGTYPGAGGG